MLACWHYGWTSHKHSNATTHLLRVYAFQRIDKYLKCLAYDDTARFTISSSKRISPRMAAFSPDAIAPRFDPDITELIGARVERNIRRLASFETNFAGLVGEGHSLFFASTLLLPGQGPGALCDPSLATTSNAFQAIGEAKRVENEFRGFCFEQFKMVERSMHGKLLTVWEGLTLEERGQVRFHSIMTVTRSTVSHLDEAHADSYDGTICCFALMSNKIGTNIYPGAQVAWRDAHRTVPTSPRAQFLHEMEGRHARPAALRYNNTELGPERGWRQGSCVILAPAVCHQIAAHEATNGAVNDATYGIDGLVLATKTDPRWFCRVTLELIPAGANAQNKHGTDDPFHLHTLDPWPAGLRSKVCMLVKECWGDLPIV
jgi:hypothetical protein